MEKRFEIYNKEGQKIVGLINFPHQGEKSTMPIILCHGFKGYMAQAFLKTSAEYLENFGCTVFRFDATNGIGESEGDIYNCTVTHYVNDLLCIIDYVSAISDLNLNKLTVFGTSMGGLVAVITASKDFRVKIITAHSAAFDWSIIKTHPDLTHPVDESRDLEFVSKSKGFTFKVNYELVTDGLKYDSYKLLKTLRIPTLLIHSGQDEAVSVEFSKKALEASAGQPKRLVIIPGATHNPQSEFIKPIFSEVAAFISTL